MNCSVSQSLPVPRATVLWINLPDGAVLFSRETEVYYGLNNVGAVIWEQLREGVPSMDLLCEAVQERFPDATLEQIRADVLELLTDFSENGLVDSVEEGLGA
jgi:hypothetical protein